ncbi:DNA topoisomerase 2 [Smittium culicis]|uniref:DNA topoisomerase 2 n=1 Tax=Smittium culicis TaxID=133412 RepID=A0A1R1XXE2_9FUNG|nr:DNA topoisomerase 2 [Smittium culicis]
MSGLPTKRQKNQPFVQNAQGSSRTARPVYYDDEEEDKYKLKSSNPLFSKVEILKEVSISIGEEIRDQNKFLQTMSSDLEQTSSNLSSRMKQFYKMAKQQGCGQILILISFFVLDYSFSKSKAPKKRLANYSGDESDDYDPSPVKKAAIASKPKSSSSKASSSNITPNVPPPKKSSNGKAIEDIYQKKSQLEHILLRPDTYIGSVEPVEEQMWTYNSTTERMEKNLVKYTPGLYKIVDEIIVNAADNKIRDPKMDTIKINFNKETGEISVYNNGKGIPIQIHKDEKCYVPELIFGHLLTSSNYNDTEKKVTGGRNGYGAKLCNIFSTRFEIETADLEQAKKYKQVFKNNMSEIGKPSLTKFSQKSEYTMVTFVPDFNKFNMSHLDDGIVQLLTRRVYDLAGCVPGVKVFLNGERIKIKSFKDYIDLYVQPSKVEPTNPDDVKPVFNKAEVIYQRISDRWEVGFAITDGQFQSVSFVNSVNTVKGGTHVTYVTDQIVSKVIALLKKKNKGSTVKPYQVKSHIWIFVNCLIENPSFDSQTKETLTLRASSFGSKCDIDDDFIKKVMKTELSSLVMNFVKYKEMQGLKKTDGTKSSRITGIVKLEDANQAGTKRSKDCTLILTEGDSAKTLAISGLSVIGRDYFGVFPLKGKLLNVRDASTSQVTNNAEISQIKQILGLKTNTNYLSADSLRYGHLMVMADQDVDGSHIKGLIINFLDTHFPSLIRMPGFLLDFITPVVKATRRNESISFYSEPEYLEWLNTVPNGGKDYTIKYYKGLGTSSSKEAKQYFGNLEHHRKTFLPASEDERKLIDLAFNKARADDRKEWLNSYVPGTYLDNTKPEIPVGDFINKELVLYSIADTARSIPSVVDGFKPTQRKIIYGCFKRNLKGEIKVAALAGYISEQTAYHHGEQSLTQSIIAMAYDFIGSNNLNLLEPKGQFGSRLQGGKDSASARYIFTTLAKLSRTIFNPDDSSLLEYIEDDGKKVEPNWYIPIVPMILINGSEGIGTGWSTNIPNYNPYDIVDNLRRLMKGENPVPMTPWYRGFKGTIEYSTPNRYKVTGIIEEIDDNTLRITELPVKTWTQSYKESLELWRTGTDKVQPIIKDFKEYHTDTKVDFYLTLTDKQMNDARKEGFEARFKLIGSISTSNMVCFDREGRIKKYDSPEAIITEFYPLRLRYYQLRKDALIAQLSEEWERLNNRARFVLEIIQKKLVVQNRKRNDIIEELFNRGYKPFPKAAKKAVVSSDDPSNKSFGNEDESSGESENESNANNAQKNKLGVSASDYDYLLSMPIWNLTYEKFEKLNKERDDCQARLDSLLAKSPKYLWSSDLDEFITNWELKLKFHKDLEMDELKARDKHDKKYNIKGRKTKRVTADTKSKLKFKTELSDDDFSVSKKSKSSIKLSDDDFSPVKKPAPRASSSNPKPRNINSKQSTLNAFVKKESDDDEEYNIPSTSTVKNEPPINENIISDDEDYSKPLSLSDRLNMIRNKKESANKNSESVSLSPVIDIKPSKINIDESPVTAPKKTTRAPAAKKLVQSAATKKAPRKPAAPRKKITQIEGSDSDNYSNKNSKSIKLSDDDDDDEVSPVDEPVAPRNSRAKRTAATKVSKYKLESDSESENASEFELSE